MQIVPKNLSGSALLYWACYIGAGLSEASFSGPWPQKWGTALPDLCQNCISLPVRAWREPPQTCGSIRTLWLIPIGVWRTDKTIITPQVAECKYIMQLRNGKSPCGIPTSCGVDSLYVYIVIMMDCFSEIFLWMFSAVSKFFAAMTTVVSGCLVSPKDNRIWNLLIPIVARVTRLTIMPCEADWTNCGMGICSSCFSRFPSIDDGSMMSTGRKHHPKLVPTPLVASIWIWYYWIFYLGRFNFCNTSCFS